MSKKVKWTLIVLVIFFLGTITYYGYSVIKFGIGIQDDSSDSRFRQFHDEDQDNENLPPEWEGRERVNILLLGGDARGLSKNEAPRSDTMMLLSIDPVTKQSHLFSILRDTYVHIPNHGHQRINAALALGGPRLAMQTVSELLDLPVHYYVYIDFEGFIQLIDAIGGVEYEVEKDMKYFDPSDDPEYQIDLKKGLQVLDGKKALQYVRFRHDRLSDFSRTERQRNFLKAVAEKMRSGSSILKIPNTLEKIEPYIETNLTLKEMWSLANLGFQMRTETTVSDQLPPYSLLRETVINNAEVITVDPDQLKEYVKNQLETVVQDPLQEPTKEVSQNQVREQQHPNI